ncbi:hypothetical protein GH714_028372 [Hevea brasiliensis]|uniref:Dof-type domain-containing protein n=1 Tax=Hevea brasiliensis TaxID=3981 RepID=A0A6A6LBP3_HEVBR|nr:hypothetical protein GH714_028372 [Hevea brasiliensis]
MSDLKDSAIKLFGKTIPLPLSHRQDFSSANESCSAAAAPAFEDFPDESTASPLDNMFGREKEAQERNRVRESSGKEITDYEHEDSTSNHVTEDSKDPTTSSDINKKPTNSSAARETSPQKSSKNGEQSDTTRHFCKNCQRYWTAGGTMRNVPVGAGRRKNKSSFASHHRHIMASEALRTAQVHAVNGNNVRNAYHRPEQRILISCGGAGDRLSGSSVTASISSKKGGNCGSKEVATNNHQGFPPQVPCFPGLPWSYPWSSPMPPPAFSPSGFPASLFPAPAYWGCTVPSPWNVAPCLSPQSPSLNHCAASSSPTSPLGKHSREGKILNLVHSEDPSRESNCSETSVLIPKTLRIDDPGEAAKCSILATLGIKSTGKSSLNGGGLFKGFQSKNEDSNYMAEKSPLLHANPAALSRSLNFHEST